MALVPSPLSLLPQGGVVKGDSRKPALLSLGGVATLVPSPMGDEESRGGPKGQLSYPSEGLEQ